MTKNAILFIPDISGFTEFVHHTEISHSRHVISELLELLIDNNTMDLELAEIEGDALFLYKLDEHIDIEVIKSQIKRMYLAFHTHLRRYEFERICQCGACSSAYNLSLKFVVHYGEIEFITVKEAIKPYGSNVIQVHRLLKNKVPLNEYAIYTENVTPITEPDKKFTLQEEYDFGTINFVYEPLSQLKTELPTLSPIPNDIPKHKVFSKKESIKVPMLELYEVISNFDYRLLWLKGVDKLEYEKNKVNRAGQKHKCLINKNQEVNQITVKKQVGKNQLAYGESTSEVPLTRRVNIYYIMEEIQNGYTELQIEIFADFKPFAILLKPLLKKNFQKIIAENIKELILLIDSGFTTEAHNS